MKTMNRTVSAGSLALLLLATGCVKLWRENLDIKTYMIEAERVAPAVDNALAGKLWVDTVSVLPPFNVRNLILRETDVVYETSYYAELLLAPAENFRNNLYTWFAGSGIFEEVSLGDRRGMSHRLSVSVLKFHGDTSSEPGSAVLEIRATLIDDYNRQTSVLFSNDYRQRIDVTERTADELIRAYNQALMLILTDLEKDMLEALQDKGQTAQ